MSALTTNPSSGNANGRPRKPSALKILHGEKRPARLTPNEPHPGSKDVEAPQQLSAAAREIWDRIAPDMARVGVLTRWDEQTLAKWCEACVTVDVTRMRLMKEEAGQLVPPGNAPAVYAWCRAISVMSQLGNQLGLTPVARTRIVTNLNAERGADADLLTG